MVATHSSPTGRVTKLAITHASNTTGMPFSARVGITALLKRAESRAPAQAPVAGSQATPVKSPGPSALSVISHGVCREAEPALQEKARQGAKPGILDQRHGATYRRVYLRHHGGGFPAPNTTPLAHARPGAPRSSLQSGHQQLRPGFRNAEAGDQCPRSAVVSSKASADQRDLCRSSQFQFISYRSSLPGLTSGGRSCPSEARHRAQGRLIDLGGVPGHVPAGRPASSGHQHQSTTRQLAPRRGQVSAASGGRISPARNQTNGTTAGSRGATL